MQMIRFLEERLLVIDDGDIIFSKRWENNPLQSRRNNANTSSRWLLQNEKGVELVNKFKVGISDSPKRRSRRGGEREKTDGRKEGTEREKMGGRREGRREGGSEGGREGEREGRRERRKEGREGEREGGKEGGKVFQIRCLRT